VFHFRSDAKNLAVLQAARIDAVSLANNHTLDFEYTAMLDMLSLLDRAGIGRAGAGINLEEASCLAVTGCRPDDGRVGLLAFTDNEPPWAANHTHPGVWHVPTDLADERAMHLLETVRCASDTVDLLIVSAHWGSNWGYRPPAEHVAFGRALIDAGAHLVFGHSAHVVRGVEVYRDRLIVYSAGDFVDDYAVDEIQRNDQSFVFVVEVEGGRIAGLELHPTVIRNMQSRRAQEPERQAIVAKMRRLCDEFGTESVWREGEGYLRIPIA
jgi:poly-gamma-glutamate capsule biosynthesis protein CapA/YwtB (metallophosphatase superfamily)